MTGLQSKANEQPNLTTIKVPHTNIITSNPQIILDTLQTHFAAGPVRVTLGDLSIPPWQDPTNPDKYTTPKRPDAKTAQLTLDHHLTKSHYIIAYQRATPRKAPGPDKIPNEIIKYLPDAAHDMIFHLFKLMTKKNYKPKKKCTSATKLIYRPNETDTNNPPSYRLIALMYYILKLWTYILTKIGTHATEIEGIFSDTSDGFRAHRHIYDSLSTYIMMYEDAKLSA
jgi:hypothetical protein